MRHIYFLQQFFERLPAPAFLKDNKFRFMWINKEAEKFFERKESEVVGKTEQSIIGDSEVEEIEKKVVKTKKSVEYEKTYNGKHYHIVRIPIRLGDGTYGVSGIAFDVTERVIEEKLLKLSNFVERIIIETLAEVPEDIIEFAKSFSRKFHSEYPDIAKTLLYKNEYLLGINDEKLLKKAQEIDSEKSFNLDRETFYVVPISDFKFVVHIPEEYRGIVKPITAFLKSHVSSALTVLESQNSKKKFIENIEKVVDIVSSWSEKKNIDLLMKKALDIIVSAIPECQKASLWILENNVYKCVTLYNYPSDFQDFTMPVEADNYTQFVKENPVVELENPWEYNRKSKYRDLWEKFGVCDENFRCLIGGFKVNERILGLIAVDNFEGKKFSFESKKLLENYVKLLTIFLK